MHNLFKEKWRERLSCKVKLLGLRMVKCYMFYSSVESREKRSKEEVEGEKEADGKIPQKIKEKKAKSSIRYHSDL